MEHLPAFKLASHEKPAPFACDGQVKLFFERSAFATEEIAVERCLECGAILHAQPILDDVVR